MEPITSPYFPVLIACGAVVIGAIFFFVGRHLRRETRDLAGGLRTASATILRKFRKPGAGSWGGLENYFVQLRYADSAGNWHEQELHVPSRVWRMLREGVTTSLNHPIAQPGAVQFGSVLARRIRRLLGALLMGIGICSALFFVIGGLREFLRALPR